MVAGFKTCSSKYWRTSLTLSSSDGRSNSTISSNLSLMAQSNWSGWLLARTNINLSMRKEAHPLNMKRVLKGHFNPVIPRVIAASLISRIVGSLRWCYTRRFTTTILAQHRGCNIVATLFQWLQHCSNIAALCWAKNRRCQSFRLTSPLSNDDGDVNENGKTAITLHVHHAFLYISLPSLHDYDEKMPSFTFSKRRGHKTTTFFFLLNFDTVF